MKLLPDNGVSPPGLSKLAPSLRGMAEGPGRYRALLASSSRCVRSDWVAAQRHARIVEGCHHGVRPIRPSGAGICPRFR